MRAARVCVCTNDQINVDLPYSTNKHMHLKGCYRIIQVFCLPLLYAHCPNKHLCFYRMRLISTARDLSTMTQKL